MSAISRVFEAAISAFSAASVAGSRSCNMPPCATAACIDSTSPGGLCRRSEVCHRQGRIDERDITHGESHGSIVVGHR
jgi:hypothetical protein